MEDFREMSPFFQDAFQELGNIGTGNAATALSQMVGHSVQMSIPKVMVVPIEEVPELVGGIEQVVAGIFLEVYGDVPSKILLTFPHERLTVLTNLLMGAGMQDNMSPKELEELKLSALKELGNILASAYLNALARFLNLEMLPSIPSLAIDSMGAILDTVLVEVSQKEQYSLMLKTEIIETEAKVSGNFFLIPESKALNKVTQAMLNATGVENAEQN